MGDQGAPEQILDRKPLPHLDELYPGTSFMQVTDKRDQSKSIVGTRRTVRNRPVFYEVPASHDEVQDAAVINAKLDLAARRDSIYSKGGIVTGHTPSLVGGQQNRAERRSHAA